MHVWKAQGNEYEIWPMQTSIKDTLSAIKAHYSITYCIISKCFAFIIFYSV